MDAKASYHIVTLGCPKNEVDSAGMAWLLEQAGYSEASSPEGADIVIVNTCGFLQIAREESLNTIRALLPLAHHGKKVVAAGCLVQRCPEDFADMEGLAGLLGTLDWHKVVGLADALIRRSDSRGVSVQYPVELPVGRRSKGFSAYIKISEGCDAPCSFCVIPQIKGRLRSKPRELILKEARELIEAGVKELVLVAQDTTAYGWDMGERDGLAHLIASLCSTIPEDVWVRIMYAYPGHVTSRLIDAMARHPQVCHYLDMPLQHASARILRAMHRPAPEHAVRHIEELRKAMPDVALRTTFIVGFPGETEDDFRELLDFVRWARFDHVGVFTYSAEPGTPAAQMSRQLPEEVKEERRRRLMTVQRQISKSKNQKLVGKVLRVLVEGEGELDEGSRKLAIVAGRAARHAPEVDGLVLVLGRVPVGTFTKVRVLQALDYDLVAKPVGELSEP